MPVAVFNRLLQTAEPYDVIRQRIARPKQLQRETAQEFSFDLCTFSLIFTYYLFVFFLLTTDPLSNQKLFLTTRR